MFNMYFVLMFILVLTSGNVYSFNLCDKNGSICQNKSSYECIVQQIKLTESQCSMISFFGTEKIKNNLGSISVKVTSNFLLHLTLTDNIWKRTFLKLSDSKTEETYNCKMYKISDTVTPQHIELNDDCFWKLGENKEYVLEYKMENKADHIAKKIFFRTPNSKTFNNSVPIMRRSIFAYMEYSDGYSIILNIQPLPSNYIVDDYKVEVFKEKGDKTNLVDIRMIAAEGSEVKQFEYITYNDEGNYYFRLSVVSDVCPENFCYKTLTPKLQISRKGTPLVIGIVGASFIIPFVLFIFHMLNRRYKQNDESEDEKTKILILYKPSSEKHNEIVAALSQLMQELTGCFTALSPINITKPPEKWCSDLLVLATHVLYVVPPFNEKNYELDFMTYNFLKEETRKALPDKDVFVVTLPYSTTEIPSIFKKCLRFEMTEDFEKLIAIFQANVVFESNATYVEMLEKIRIETESRGNMPQIIITEQSDQSDEPKEDDVLL